MIFSFQLKNKTFILGGRKSSLRGTNAVPKKVVTWPNWYTSYYPFGLIMAGISSKAAGKLENKFKFNKSSELQHQEFSDGSGLEIYDTQFRNLDPQLGRWNQVDPKIEEDQESSSPYVSMGNNPILKNDPLGDVPECDWCKEAWQNFKDNMASAAATAVNTVSALASNLKENIDNGRTLPQTIAADFSKNPLSAVTGIGGVGLKAAGALIGSEASSVVKEVSATTGKDFELVQRAMSIDELTSTKSTGLVRGGREGTHYVSNEIGNDAKQVRQRLALPQTPEVNVTMKVPKGSFSSPSKVDAANKMPGGGLERKATGKIPAEVIKVYKLKNTAN